MRCEQGWFLLEVLREESVCLFSASVVARISWFIAGPPPSKCITPVSACLNTVRTFSSATHSLCLLLTRILVITFSTPGSFPHLKILNFNHICKVPFAILLGNIHRSLRLEPQYLQRPLSSLLQMMLKTLGLLF